MTLALSWFTPLPPARNGIADYAGLLLHEISKHARCICYCEDPFAEAPADVEVRDPLQAFRHLDAASPILHQIGNNRGHVFALDALRRYGGIVSLHDLSLLYLNELGTSRIADIYGRMQSPARALGATYARHWKDANLKTGANYVLFDMTGEILSRARHVIVHSYFARNKLIAMYGESVGARIAVIPHFAKRLAITTDLQARRALGIDPDEVLILTSGFATQAKRFDWLIEALDQLQRRGHRFRWVHAGEERATEYALSRAIQARPGLAERCEVTGYLADDRLDCYISAADIVVNLRFPSVGESSGTLARAFSAGRCCLVSDTAAYAEIPREAVVHVPVFDTVAALVCALDHLIGDRTLRQTFGTRARQFARKCLSLESIAKRYLEVIAESYAVDRPPSDAPLAEPNPVSLRPAEPIRLEFGIDDPPRDLAATLGPGTRELDLTLWFSSSSHFATTVLDRPELVHSMLGPHVEIDGLKFMADGVTAGDRIGIRVIGRACG